MKYNIEGGINFYDELNKSLKDDKDDKDEMMECLITCMPLTENHITLECNHKFNYIALYKEIVKQKLVYKTYSQHTLNAKDMQKFREVKQDYFIRCPYCRNIQFDILPYYPEMTLPEIYGINSTDINSSFAFTFTDLSLSMDIIAYTMILNIFYINIFCINIFLFIHYLLN